MNKTAYNISWEAISTITPPWLRQRLRERYLRVYEALLLGLSYAESELMVLHGSLIGEGVSLAESEKVAAQLDSMFGTSTPADYFVPHDDENTDESIKRYKLFQVYVSLLRHFGYTEKNVTDLCKDIHEEMIKELETLRFRANLDWRYWMEGLLAYMEGQRTYEQLVMTFKKYNFLTT